MTKERVGVTSLVCYLPEPMMFCVRVHRSPCLSTLTIVVYVVLLQSTSELVHSQSSTGSAYERPHTKQEWHQGFASPLLVQRFQLLIFLPKRNQLVRSLTGAGFCLFRVLCANDDYIPL